MDQRMRKRIVLVNLVMTCIIAMFHFSNAALDPLSATDEKVSGLITKAMEISSYFAMNWFFILTGFLLFRDYTPEQYPTKLKKRFLGVFVPYLLWQLAFGFKDLLSGKFLPFIQTTFLMKVDPPDGPLWYMCAIFYLAVLSPLFYPLLKNKKAGLITVVLVTVGSYYMSVTKAPVLSSIGHYGRVWNVFLYLGAYFCGLYLGLHHVNPKPKEVLPLIAGYCLVGIAGAFFDTGFLFAVLRRVVPLLMLCFFPAIENERFCKYASGAFLIYALHAATKWGRITRIRRIYLLPISRAAWFLNLFSRVGALVYTIGVAVVLWGLSSLFCPVVLRLFTGGRVKPLFRPIWQLLGKKSENRPPAKEA